MASAKLGRWVEKVVGYPPLSEMSSGQRREFHEALLDACDVMRRGRAGSRRRNERRSVSEEREQEGQPESAEGEGGIEAVEEGA
jgi:hypothetical protein